MGTKTYNIGPCECCGESDPPAPCTCPEGLTGNYKISGWNSEFFGAFDETYAANDDYSDGSLWDGVLANTPPPGNSPCQWVPEGTIPAIPPLYIKNTSDGKYYETGGSGGGLVYLVLDTSTCKWSLEMRVASFDTETQWLGSKSTGLTPVGVYTKTFGSSPVSSITITAV